MKRFVLVLAACSGGDKPVERPVVVTPAPTETVKPTAPVSPPHVGPPLAGAKPVRETMHGVVVEDPYRWLEGNDAAVKQWQDAQNAHTRKILDGLPEIEPLRAEVTAIMKAPITTYGTPIEAKGKLFLTRKQPTKEQSELVVIDDPAKAADARVILDPSAESATKSIVWFRPSPDGTRVAVVITDKGSEAGDLHILGLDGKSLEVVPNVNRGTGGGSAVWTPR